MWLLYLSGYAAAAIIASYLVYLIVYQYSYWKIRKMLHIELVPILGNNYPILFRKVSFPIHFQNLYKRCPGARYYGSFDIRKPQVIIKDPELIRDVCVKSFDHFTDHEAFVTEEMDPIVGRNIFSLTGQRWKDVRSTLSPSYTATRMKLLFELITECSNEFAQYFLEHPEISKEFEAKEAFKRYTNDVIATSAFGVKVNSMRNRDNEFFAHGKLATSFDGWWFAKITLLRMFSRTMRLLFGATFLPKAADQFFKRLIRETVRMREENNIVRPDMIQLLVQAMKNQDGVEVSIDDVLGQAFIFFLAGFDTSSSLMSFMLHELAVNVEVQAKLHREIDQLLPNDEDKLTYESLMEMKYLDMVVSETLRLYPPGPITNRVCTKNHKFPSPMEGYPEYCMEKGTIVLIPIFGLHRDPKYFHDPEKFIPNRFTSENKSEINPYAYLPFGFGPRKCIGNRFALMETKIVIVQLLRKFFVRPTDKTSYPVEFSSKGFNLNAANGLWVRLEERKKFN